MEYWCKRKKKYFDICYPHFKKRKINSFNEKNNSLTLRKRYFTFFFFFYFNCCACLLTSPSLSVPPLSQPHIQIYILSHFKDGTSGLLALKLLFYRNGYHNFSIYFREFLQIHVRYKPSNVNTLWKDLKVWNKC